jgi:hypothetical protein
MKHNIQPSLIPDTSHPSFQQFWDAYPRKVSKADAEKAFNMVIRKLDIQTLLTAIEIQKKSKEWTKEQGMFIPYPASWLRSMGWENTLIAPTPTTELSPVEKQIHGAEYQRVITAMQLISGTYASHQNWSKDDLMRYRQLKTRRNELRTMLNILV